MDEKVGKGSFKDSSLDSLGKTDLDTVGESMGFQREIPQKQFSND